MAGLVVVCKKRKLLKRRTGAPTSCGPAGVSSPPSLDVWGTIPHLAQSSAAILPIALNPSLVSNATSIDSSFSWWLVAFKMISIPMKQMSPNWPIRLKNFSVRFLPYPASQALFFFFVMISSCWRKHSLVLGLPRLASWIYRSCSWSLHPLEEQTDCGGHVRSHSKCSQLVWSFEEGICLLNLMWVSTHYGNFETGRDVNFEEENIPPLSYVCWDVLQLTP